MFLMLAVIFTFLVLGLLARRLGTSENVAIALIASVMTMLYMLFTQRFI